MSQTLDLGNIRGSKWYLGTEVQHESGKSRVTTSVGIANVGDLYLNTGTGAIYQCTEGGSNGSAEWEYKGNLVNDVAVNLNLTNAVEQGNEKAVTSDGVWSKLNELGLLTPPETADTFQYTLGDSTTPEGGIDVSDWIDDSGAATNNWILSPDASQNWHIDNGGTVGRGLTVALPQQADVGAHIAVFFRPSGQASTCADVTISNNVMVVGDATPETIGGVTLECTMSAFGWIVERHYAITAAPATTYTAKIIYSGANRKATGKTSFTETVTWTDTDDSARTKTLSTSYFRRLCGKAPFKGWTTSKTGNTVIYADGATVTLNPNQTLTLYPLYEATSVAVNLGMTSTFSFTIPAKGGDRTERHKNFVFKPTDAIPGFCGDKYKLEIYGYVYTGNHKYCEVGYSIGTGEDKRIAYTDGLTASNATVTIEKEGSSNLTFNFYGFAKDGTAAVTASFKAYVKSMTIW